MNNTQLLQLIKAAEDIKTNSISDKIDDHLTNFGLGNKAFSGSIIGKGLNLLSNPKLLKETINTNVDAQLTPFGLGSKSSIGSRTATGLNLLFNPELLRETINTNLPIGKSYLDPIYKQMGINEDQNILDRIGFGFKYLTDTENTKKQMVDSLLTRLKPPPKPPAGQVATPPVDQAATTAATQVAAPTTPPATQVAAPTTPSATPDSFSALDTHLDKILEPAEINTVKQFLTQNKASANLGRIDKMLLIAQFAVQHPAIFAKINTPENNALIFN